MRRIAIACALVFFVTAILLPMVASAGLQTRLLDPAAMADAIDRYVMEEMRATRVPGIALGIVHDGMLAYLKGYGLADASGRPVTPQTPFALGSL